MRRFRTGLDGALVLVLLLVASAHGAEPTAAERRAGRLLYDQGLRKFGKGDHQASALSFDRAYALWQNPKFLWNAARALSRLLGSMLARPR